MLHKPKWTFTLTSTNQSHLFRHRSTQLDLNTRSTQDMYPKSLRVAQPIVLALYFGKLDFALLSAIRFICSSPEE
jgi:hypothetical protein